MTVDRHAGDLRAATRRLETALAQARSWDDQARRSFDERFVRPLESETRNAQQAIDRLAVEIDRALKQLK
ncbi:MAG: hypothetical protein AAGC46_10220 [Solirubrobacteraceae bacterium]|nr:hypothetical protein [Patulibacter sp.]